MLKISAGDLSAIRAASSSLDQAATIATAELDRVMQPAISGFHPFQSAKAAKAATAARLEQMQDIHSHAQAAVFSLRHASDGPAVALARESAEAVINSIEHGMPHVKKPSYAPQWRGYGHVASDAQRSAASTRTLVDALDAPTLDSALAAIADGGTRQQRGLAAAVAASREDGLGLIGRTLTREFTGPRSVVGGSPESLALDAQFHRSTALEHALQWSKDGGGEAKAIRGSWRQVLSSVTRDSHDLAAVNRSGLVTATASADSHGLTAGEIAEHFHAVAKASGNEGRELPAWFAALDQGAPVQLGRVEAEELRLLATARDAAAIGDHVASELAKVPRSKHVVIAPTSHDAGGGVRVHVSGYDYVPSADPRVVAPAIASQRLPDGLRPEFPTWVHDELAFRLGEPLAIPTRAVAG